MVLSRKQLTKIIDEQSKRLPRDSFSSYDSNDSNEQLLIFRHENEMRIFFELIKKSYSRNVDEMDFQERICKQEIISAILSDGESYHFDYQIWHALNKIYYVLDEIFKKISSDFFNQYPHFIFDKNILLDIAMSHLTSVSVFSVEVMFLPTHTYCDFKKLYQFYKFEEFKDFIKNPKKQLIDSVNSSIGLHYSIPVRAILNTYLIFDGERRLYQTCLYDIKYDTSKKKIVIVKL